MSELREVLRWAGARRTSEGHMARGQRATQGQRAKTACTKVGASREVQTEVGPEMVTPTRNLTAHLDAA
eukprot:3508632-Prymnesium_polylepis.2